MRNQFNSTVKKAEKIIATNDLGAIKVLLDELGRNDEQACVSNADVLYQIGSKVPELIEMHAKTIINHLKTKSVKLRLRYMDILLTIVHLQHGCIWSNMNEICDYMISDSEALVNKLTALIIELSSYSEYKKECSYALLALLEVCSSSHAVTYEESMNLEYMNLNTRNMLKNSLLRYYDMFTPDQQKKITNLLERLG